ncbi:MAG: ATP-binding protein [Planctomycetota bacterium]
MPQSLSHLPGLGPGPGHIATDRSNRKDAAHHGLHLDPTVERQAKRGRDARYHTLELPRLRAIGFALIVMLVALHQRIVPVRELTIPWTTYGIGATGYAALSWLALRRWYHWEARVHLGRLFLLLDLVPIGAAVWATGGGTSWLFLLPYIRVFDQVHIGVRWCLTCTAAALAAHLSVIALDHYVGARSPLGVELLKLSACASFALYLSMTSLTAERMRLRNSRAVVLARELVRELEQQAVDLNRARVEAESAAVAKGSFLATMSHEIRTPMNGILGMIELAQDTTDEDERREFLATARSSAGALLQILGDVLDFSKIEAGQMRVEATAFDLRELIAQSMQLISVIARPKGLNLAVSVDDDLPQRIIGDPLRTRQVLLNLLGNAVKFTPEGEVRIIAVRKLESDGSARLVCCVTDTGIGIDPRQLETVFAAFTQAEMTTSRRFGGTGLGLSISRRLAELMGGSLTADSKLGTGSTFRLSLPLLPAPQEAAEPRAPLPAAEGRAEPYLATTGRPASRRATERPLALLLVEDNPVNQRVARLLLQRWGHTVDVAENGAEALEALSRKAYDAALMDMQMPVMDGVAATQALRSRDTRARSGARLPVIAMTANTLQGDRERCLAAGMDDYVAKPISTDELFEKLERLAAAPTQPAP